jgi:tetratricopeptide (TPR) repeat protein
LLLESTPVLLRAAASLALFSAASPAGASVAECGQAAYECALAHVSRGEFEEAVELLEAEVARAPADLKRLNLLGIALTGAGRVEEANARFEAALESDPGFHPARRNRAINLFNGGRLEEAQRGFEAVLEQTPEDEVVHLHLAEIHFARRATAEALPHYEKSRARALQNPISTLHYGRSLLAEGRREQAAVVLAALPERDAERRFQAGLALGEAGAHAAAARFFASARAGHPDPGAAGYNQVLMLLEAGDADAAVAVAGELVEAGRGTGELLNLVARAHLEAGRVVEAYDALREATRLDPSAEENYFDLASICLEHENYDLGLEIVDIGLGALPGSVGLRLQRAVLLAEKGMLPAAEAEFEVARALAPGSPAPAVGLAMAWMQIGQTERAVEMLRQAAGEDSGEAMIPYVFGLALVRSGADTSGPEGSEAVAAFEAALRRNPGFSAAHAELGKLRLKRGELEMAVAALERALELDPEAPAAAYMLARAYQAAGDRERARELLSRSDRLRGDGPEADADAELRRVMIRIVREGSEPATTTGPRR